MNTPPRRDRISKSVPFPVSIELHNLFPVKIECLPAKGYRPEHSTSLLHYIKLQVIIQDNVIIYESVSDKRTTCPSWRHLDEHINRKILSADEYESMCASFSLNSSEPDSDAKGVQDSFQMRIAIHPSKLVLVDAIPAELPLNALVVRFSDNSIRLTPPAYRLVLERTSQTSLLRNKSETIVSNHPQLEDNMSRFKDDAFRTLDQVTPNRETSLLETDDEAQATPIRDLEQPDLEDDELSFEQAIREEDLLMEQRQLEQLLAECSVALEQDVKELVNYREPLRERIEQIKCTNEQTEEVVRATHEMEHDARRTAFLLEAQRIRLFRELRSIYPITSVPSEQRYFIRGLEIPSDLFAGTVSDEELSASLGYLCHLTTMMSKYLSIQFRYRQLWYSSRSAIQEDGALYPLFPARNVEREQVEYGVHLMGRNVQRICYERHIRVSPKLHVLAKVKRIFENVIEGY